MSRLAQANRLKVSAEFTRVLRRKKRLSSVHFDCFYHHGNAQDGTPRLGVVVVKRFARQAVTRNLVKRIVSEAFRDIILRRSNLQVDVVVRLRVHLKNRVRATDRSVLRLELTQLLTRLLGCVRN